MQDETGRWNENFFNKLAKVWPLEKTERTSLSTSSRLIGLNYFCAKREEARSAEFYSAGAGLIEPTSQQKFWFSYNMFELVHFKAIISWINFCTYFLHLPDFAILTRVLSRDYVNRLIKLTSQAIRGATVASEKMGKWFHWIHRKKHY